MDSKLQIINQTKGKIPNLPLVRLKDEILGKRYELSVAFVAPKQSKIINQKYRDKNKPTNILSFPLSKNVGELILCPAVIKKEYKNFEKTYDQFVGFLVIHGMLHLKGFVHGSIMEKLEQKYDQKYFSGHRRGISHDASRGRRISKGRKKS